MTTVATHADQGLVKDAIALRRELHQQPRGSDDEGDTRDRVAHWLEERGIACQTIGGSGLLAHRPGDGPKILCRADLDALPLTEETSADYASKQDGLHHACGHDGHMAMLAAAIVSAPAGPDVWALFQPAEETGHGMKRCLDSGLLDLDWHRVWAIHNVPGHALGNVIIRDGTMALASTGIALRFQGATSHAAEPEKARNAAFPIADVVPQVTAALAPPGDHHARAAIVGTKVGGARFGTTAGSGSLWMTIRASTDQGLKEMEDRLVAIGRAAADKHGLDLEVRHHEPFPATLNDAGAVKDARSAAGAASLEIEELAAPFAWSEDFGHATHRWPGALMGLGSGMDTPDLHAPDYDFPDDLIPHGIRLWHALMQVNP